MGNASKDAKAHICRANPENGCKTYNASVLKRIVFASSRSGMPGVWISTDENWEIFVVDVDERKSRKLATNITNITRPHWSRDGKCIYFISAEPGRTGLYRCPASGGDAALLSEGAVVINPRGSFDGKTVYFASNYDKSTLKQLALPAPPDTESKVDGMP